MLAYQMNGADIPMLNGYPVKPRSCPGYYGTYWVKHLSEIEVIDTGLRRLLDEAGVPHPRQRLRLRRARHRAGRDPPDRPLQRALVHHLGRQDGEVRCAPDNRPLAVRGIAFDGGQGIREVAVLDRRRPGPGAARR